MYAKQIGNDGGFDQATQQLFASHRHAVFVASPPGSSAKYCDVNQSINE